MAAAGFTPEDYAIDFEGVWPENWPAWCLFQSLSTQWRYTSVGLDKLVRTGLDYAALYPLLDREALTKQEWNDLFHDVQTCEDAALAELRKNR